MGTSLDFQVLVLWNIVLDRDPWDAAVKETFSLLRKSILLRSRVRSVMGLCPGRKGCIFLFVNSFYTPVAALCSSLCLSLLCLIRRAIFR